MTVTLENKIWKFYRWQQFQGHSSTGSLMFHFVFSVCSVTEYETTNEPEMPLCMKKSKRRKPVLVDNNGFEYTCHGKQQLGRIRWRCRRELQSSKCNAKILTMAAEDGYAIIRKINFHSCHLPHDTLHITTTESDDWLMLILIKYLVQNKWNN